MRLVGVCLVVLLITGCRKSDDHNQASSELFSNSVGDTWTYLVHDTTWQNGQIIDISNYAMTASVIEKRLLAGGIPAKVWVYKWPAHSDTCYVTISADTIRFADIHEIGLHVFSREYLAPFTVNSSWPYVGGMYKVQVDSQANVAIGSNLFKNSFHISGFAGMPDGIFMIDEWFENNVGTVKRYYNGFGMAIGIVHTISWSLTSYHLQ